MEKDAKKTQTPISRQTSETSSIRTPSETHGELDIEQDGGRPELSRTISSGPPYSIFTNRTKLFIVAAVSVSGLISPFGAVTFYPVLNVLARQLHVTPSAINISLTTYMIAQAIAPSIIAGMSDTSGRRLSFIVCFIIYIAANIGLALQTNYAALLVLRMVQAAGCSAAIALSNAVVADIATSAERGKFMGYATGGLLFGPAFGPTIGGVLAQYLGWRSIFWFLVIFTSVLLVVFVILFPETCRNVVGNGSIPAKGINLSLLGYLQQRRHARENESIHEDQASLQLKKKRKLNLPNPLGMLRILTEKESGILLLYNGLFFTSMMICTAALPHLYEVTYHLNTLDIGLCYIALGVGSMASTLTMGHVVDWNFRRHARRLGLVIKKGKQQDLADFPIEVVRFQVVLPGHVIGTLAMLTFGWTIDFATHIAGPEIALFFVGFGVSTSFNLTNTLLIDLHRDKPATATAAVNFVRCLMTAAGAAAIIPMCNAMTIGWAFTFLSILYALSISIALVIMKKGQMWREETNEKKRRKQEAEHAAFEADVEKQIEADQHSERSREGLEKSPSSPKG